MTPQEFKAWFEGFTESMSGPPTKKQWERILARVQQINGTEIRYLRDYWPWYSKPVYCNVSNQNALQNIASETIGGSLYSLCSIGRAEYSQVTA